MRCLLVTYELLSRAKLWIGGLRWLKQNIASNLITKEIEKFSDEKYGQVISINKSSSCSLYVTNNDRKRYRCKSLQFIIKTAKSFSNLLEICK